MTDPCGIERLPLLTLDQALQRMRAAIIPLAETQEVLLTQAYGRVAAENVYSAINLPFDTNAAMDGYALNSADIKQNQAFSLELAGISWAGQPFTKTLKAGQCVRIFTGAVLPAGADTVVMQEKVNNDGDRIFFPEVVNSADNVRLAGEDVPAGGLLCAKGTKLTPMAIGLLAAAGVNKIKVYRLVNLAFFSTGNELVSLGCALKPGQIYDSNRHILRGLLTDPAVRFSDMGTVPDDKAELARVIRHAAGNHDVMLSTGGASVGDADYVQEILAELGEVGLWKIAVKPGKPLVFGKVGDCYYFGLPGNPVSMTVLFNQVVKPMLALLSGMAESKALRIRAVCIGNLKKSPGRLEFQRGILAWDKDGVCTVASAGKQGSHILSSLSRSNCLIILPAECAGVSAGETVLVEPYGSAF